MNAWFKEYGGAAIAVLITVSSLGIMSHLLMQDARYKEAQELINLQEHKIAQGNHVLPPCLEEDSDNCYWLANEQGNGVGLSFIVQNGVVTYLGK